MQDVKNTPAQYAVPAKAVFAMLVIALLGIIALCVQTNAALSDCQNAAIAANYTTEQVIAVCNSRGN